MVRYLNLEYWFYQIYLLLRAVYNFATSGPDELPLMMLMTLSLIFSILFLWLMIYSWYKTLLIRRKEKDDFMAAFAAATDPKVEHSTEWQDILDHVDGENESEWKLALIEADKILENLLRENGYDGVSIGERLKAAEGVGGLKSLQDAWTAHKIRNRIAHETGFVLTKREARIAIESYKKVFEELHFL